MVELTENDRAILQHVRLYSLTTASAVARSLGRPKPACRIALARLARRKILYRHKRRRSHGNSAVFFYSRVQDPKPHVVRTAFSILWFCCLNPSPRPLIARGAFRRLTTPVTQAAALPPMRYARCYRELTSEGQASRISLIRLADGSVYRNLNQAMVQLQEFVDRRQFLPWTYFASLNGLSITYLLVEENLVQELTAWLERHPLVCRSRRKALAIPVVVARSEEP